MTTASLTAPSSSKKALRVALWVTQGLVALAFIGAGFMKSTAPLAELGQEMAWVNAVPGALVRFIGLAELAGGLGLLLPALTRIKPILTPIAASALVLVMVLAAGFHITHGEAALIAPNVILGGLAAFIAHGRFKLAPIAPRS